MFIMCLLRYRTLIGCIESMNERLVERTVDGFPYMKGVRVAELLPTAMRMKVPRNLDEIIASVPSFEELMAVTVIEPSLARGRWGGREWSKSRRVGSMR